MPWVEVTWPSALCSTAQFEISARLSIHQSGTDTIMTSHRTNLPDEATLDQQWDDFLNGDPPANLESTVAALRPGTLGWAPSRMFVSQLRDLIATAAGERVHIDQAETPAPRIANQKRLLPLGTEPVQPVGGRVRGLSGAARIASVLLAASLLIAMVAAVARYPFRDSTGTGGPTVVAPGRSDPGRTDARRRSGPHRRPTRP